MLTALSIRDVVLIERLDLSFGPGLTVLTGETGAGKSILLDSLGLALGARADAGTGARGRRRRPVSPPASRRRAGHPLTALLVEQGLEAEDEVVLRRVLTKDGRSRAFINDQPVGVGAAAAGRRRCWSRCRASTSRSAWPIRPATPGCSTRSACRGRCATPPRRHGARWRDAVAALAAAREAIAAAERDEEWLRHAVEELAGLAPQEGEEERLAQERQRLQQGERRAEAIAAALAELAPRDRRSRGPRRRCARRAARCSGWSRRRSRMRPIRRRRRSPRWNARRRRWPRRRRLLHAAGA